MIIRHLPVTKFLKLSSKLASEHSRNEKWLEMSSYPIISQTEDLNCARSVCLATRNDITVFGLPTTVSTSPFSTLSEDSIYSNSLQSLLVPMPNTVPHGVRPHLLLVPFHAIIQSGILPNSSFNPNSPQITSWKKHITGVSSSPPGHCGRWSQMSLRAMHGWEPSSEGDGHAASFFFSHAEKMIFCQKLLKLHRLLKWENVGTVKCSIQHLSNPSDGVITHKQYAVFLCHGVRTVDTADAQISYM